MKDYYEILRVRKTASGVEIRKSYRVLVQQYHPDVNPNPVAHEMILEINEAYDVLGDEAKRVAYDYSLENPYVTVALPQQPVHRDPAYKRRAYPPAAPRENPQREIMVRYLHLVTKLAWAGCVLCFVLAIDFGIPHRVTADTVETFRSEGNRRASRNYLVTHSNRYLRISDQDWRLFEIDQRLEIIESRLFSILVEIRIPKKEIRITNLSTVYANYFFILVVLLILSVAALVIKGTLEFRFNLGIVIFFVFIFTLILLLK